MFGKDQTVNRDQSGEDQCSKNKIILKELFQLYSKIQIKYLY